MLFNKLVLTACARHVLAINIKWWITLNLEFTYYTNKIYKLFDFEVLRNFTIYERRNM